MPLPVYNGDELLYLIVADRSEHDESIAGAVGTADDE